MRKAIRIWGILGLVVCVSGCPDGPPQILRDELNAVSEVSDYLSKVTDEETAKIALSVVKKLNERWESIKKRRDAFIKMADTVELLQFSIWQNPDAIKSKLEPPIPSEVQEMFASASYQYVKELEASAMRLRNDAARVSTLSISDPTVFMEIQQFERKVFGANLKPPDLPLTIPDNKKLTVWVNKYKDNLSPSMGGNISTVILFIALGLAVAGVAITFLFRR
jgi:hypothetical protein